MFWFISTIIILYLYLLLIHFTNSDKKSNKNIINFLKINTKKCLKFIDYSNKNIKNPLVSMKYANYSRAYLIIIKDSLEYFNIPIYVFENLMGINLNYLEKTIKTIEEKSLKINELK